MKISILPALIVAYKRLENTEKLINDCIKFGCPKIYLAVDNSTTWQKKFMNAPLSQSIFGIETKTTALLLPWSAVSVGFLSTKRLDIF